MVAIISIYLVYFILKSMVRVDSRSNYIDDDIDLIMNGVYNVGDEFKL